MQLIHKDFFFNHRLENSIALKSRGEDVIFSVVLQSKEQIKIKRGTGDF